MHALMLALASSTDNFAVGFSAGIKQKSLSTSMNGFIAVCNASGAMLAATAGGVIALSTAAPLLASLAFAYLGYQELTKDNSSVQEIMSYSLAFPMTLNRRQSCGCCWNSASPLYAFAASLVAMACGHVLGWKLSNRPSFRGDDRSSLQVAAFIYCTLSLVTFY